jgi:hypothetical protein
VASGPWLNLHAAPNLHAPIWNA